MRRIFMAAAVAAVASNGYALVFTSTPTSTTNTTTDSSTPTVRGGRNFGGSVTLKGQLGVGTTSPASGYQADINGNEIVRGSISATNDISASAFRASGGFQGSASQLYNLERGVTEYFKLVVATGVYQSSMSFVSTSDYYMVGRSTLQVLEFQGWTVRQSSIAPAAFRLIQTTCPNTPSIFSYVTSTVTISTNTSYSPWVSPDTTSSGTVNSGSWLSFLITTCPAPVSAVPSMGAPFGVNIRATRRPE